MTTSYPLDRRKRAGHLPRQIYLPRALGFGLGCLGMAVALGEHGAPRWVWLVFIFGAYVWPHIAFQISSRAHRPGRAERRNLLIDAALVSFAIYATGANIVPSATAFTIVAMNNIAVGGWNMWRRGFLGVAAGIAIGAALLPWKFNPGSSLEVQYASMAVLLIYFTAFGATMWDVSTRLQRKRDELQVAAEVDSLSGVMNRGTFETHLWKRFAKAKAETGGRFFAVLMIIDLDHFKNVNDAFGHAAGDAAIRRFGFALRSATRRGDMCGRYGGDEFVVLLIDADRQDAEAFAARLQRVLMNERRPTDGFGEISCSIGAAAYRSEFLNAGEWLERADAALYSIKETRRGGFEFFDECDAVLQPVNVGPAV